MTPYVDGARYDTTFIDMCTGYPVLTTIPDRSAASLIEAIESLHDELAHTTGDMDKAGIKVANVSLDQSWFEGPLEIFDIRLSAHMASLHYTVSRLPATRSDNQTLAADFYGLAAAHTLKTSQLFEPSILMKRQARKRFVCTTINTVDGPMSRLQALTGSPLNAPLLETRMANTDKCALFDSFPHLRLLLPESNA